MIAALTAACMLSWNPQPDATGFRIWRGLDCIATVTTNRATVQLPTYQLSTLTVTAINGTDESEHSDPITAIPVTPLSSERLDLKPELWTKQKPFFVEAKPSQFFRFSFPQ